MTKKEQKELNNRNRTLVLFNTSTRTHEDKRKPKRKKAENKKKVLDRVLLMCYTISEVKKRNINK